VLEDIDQLYYNEVLNLTNIVAISQKLYLVESFRRYAFYIPRGELEDLWANG
jgi:hypothetical protein